MECVVFSAVAPRLFIFTAWASAGGRLYHTGINPDQARQVV